MVNPIKGCTEINLHDYCLLPTLQCTLQCMGHAQNCITVTKSFPISKLGGWQHAIAFHKSSKTNRYQVLKHLWQRWCYGNRSVIGNRGGRWTLRNWGDIDLSPAMWKLPRRTSRRNPTLRCMGDHNISSSLKKMRKRTQWVSATIRVQDLPREASPLSTWRQWW